jgi:HD-like signal output (HDOD) protein
MIETARTETTGLVQQFVERTGQLFSLPAAAAEILRLTGEPRIDPRAIKKCLESDPALAARILRVVNSSLFGPSRHVSDLGQALTLLGIRPLKMLVLGFSLPKELFAGLQAEVLERYWRHTLVKAIAARELSERLWRVPGDEPFLAGLVQDIGVLALIQQLGEPYIKLLGHVHTHGGPLLAAELEALGFDHLIVSARLLDHWGLPAGLCAAISVPPDLRRLDELLPGERTLPQMLHLAGLLSRLIDQPYGSALHELLTCGSRYCDLTYDELKPIVQTLQSKVEELAEVLALQLPEGQSYVDLLIAAQQRLADETIALAAESGGGWLSDGPPSTGQARQERIRNDHVASENQLGAITDHLRDELAHAASRPVASNPTMVPVAAPPNRDSTPAPRSTVRSPHPPAAPTSDSVLAHRVAAAAQHARQSRTPLTLALFEIEHFGDLLIQLGPPGAIELIHALRSALPNWSGQRSEALLVSDNRLAVLWTCGRSEGVRMARSILGSVRTWSRARFPLHNDVTLSAGLATLEFAPKNFPPSDLLEAATRCLSGALLSGGDTVKSIEF